MTLDGAVDLCNVEKELAGFDDGRLFQVGLQIPGNVVQLGKVEWRREGQDVVRQAHDRVAQKFGKVLLAAAGFNDLINLANDVGFNFLIVHLLTKFNQLFIFFVSASFIIEKHLFFATFFFLKSLAW